MDPTAPKLRILVRHSSSANDRYLVEELLGHLRPLQRSAGIDVWSDEQIRAGAETRREIDRAVDQADVVLLLLSADFFASDGLVELEIPEFLARHAEGKLRVIPILMRSCVWEVHPWLRDLHPLPKGGKPLGSFSAEERDAVLTEVAREIIGLSTASHVTGQILEPRPIPPAATAPVASGLRPLIVLGPHLIAEGERVAASGSTWTVRLYRFLLGDTSALSQVSESDGTLPTEDRFIVLSQPGEARAIAGDVSWRAESGYVEVQVPVAPPRPKRSVADLESTDLDTMTRVSGAAAGRTFLQTWLGTAVGHLGDELGTWIPAWLRGPELASRLGDLVRIEILRMASVIRVDQFSAEVYVPLGFVERVLSVQVRRGAGETGEALADIEVSFVDGGTWKGEIMIATRLPEVVAVDHDRGLRELVAGVARAPRHEQNMRGSPAAAPSRPSPAPTTTAPLGRTITLASVYLSYGDDDLPFARKLFEALEAVGVPVFFRHEHAVPGAHRHRSARRTIREYEHVILLCSERSLRAPSVASELDEMLSREFNDGASERIVPVLLDDFVSHGWEPRHPDLRRAVLDRVPLDMKDADGDRARFDKALKRLLGALRG
ncbi:toll/interleukin-1 receptor domain-containing protein [Sorangium sp. So ce341]|uniref:toll/interleukin-1 receptor domain-containing protein n=1 Tax=Sorangium sp. So ce341 TaxID=3133302 RepID=UPI003F5F232B